jgi:hypothetical protein
MSLYHLKSCMSRNLVVWSRRVSLAECSCSSFALTIVYMFLPPLSSSKAIDGHQGEVQALRARFRIETHHRCRVAKEGFHL